MNMYTDTVCPEDLLVDLLLLFVKHTKEKNTFFLLEELAS